MLLVVIALAAPAGHLSALPGGAGGWQSGRLACIASRLADRPQTLDTARMPHAAVSSRRPAGSGSPHCCA